MIIKTIIINIISTTIKAIKHTVSIVKLIMTETIVQKSICNTMFFPNALTFRTILGIDTGSTAVPSIKVADYSVGFIITKPVSYNCIFNFVSVSSFAFAFFTKFPIDTGSTAITPIKRAMAIVVEIMAITIPNKCSELACYIRERSKCLVA